MRKSYLENGFFLFLVFSIFLGVLPAARAAYEDELRDQIKKVETDYLRTPQMTYFRDMGIIARKADEAELGGLASEIIRVKLLKTMDDYVRSEFGRLPAAWEASLAKGA